MNSHLRNIKAVLDEHPLARICQQTAIVNPNEPTKHDWATQLVTFFVYPTHGTYAPGPLQGFADSLAGRAKLRFQTHTSSQPFFMNFPCMYADEIIGQQRYEATPYLYVNDPDVDLPDSFINGARALEPITVNQRDLYRRIIVNVYPDRAFAERAATGQDVRNTRLVSGDGVAYRTT